MKKILKNKIKIIIFFFISLISLLVLYKINLLDFGLLFNSIKISPKLTFLAICLYMFSIFLGSLRYRIILANFGYTISLHDSFKIITSSIFYGQWFPGSSALIEMFRIFFLKKYLKINIKESIFSVIYDRAIGLVSFILICLIAISIKFNLIEKLGYYFFLIVIIGLVATYYLPLVIFKILRINFTQKNILLISNEMIISLIISLGIIITYYFISRITDASLSISDIAIMMPLIAIITILPLGIGNFGGLQIGTLLIFQFISEKNSEIISMSITFAIITLIVNTIFGFIFFKSSLDVFKKTIMNYEKKK